jgi:hypothetical protein
MLSAQEEMGMPKCQWKSRGVYRKKINELTLIWFDLNLKLN